MGRVGAQEPQGPRRSGGVGSFGEGTTLDPRPLCPGPGPLVRSSSGPRQLDWVQRLLKGSRAGLGPLEAPEWSTEGPEQQPGKGTWGRPGAGGWGRGLREGTEGGDWGGDRGGGWGRGLEQGAGGGDWGRGLREGRGLGQGAGGGDRGSGLGEGTGAGGWGRGLGWRRTGQGRVTPRAERT